MKYLIFFLLIFLSGCGSNQINEHQELLASIKDRYGLGISHQDYNHQNNPFKYADVDGGLVIRQIAPASKAFKAGVKSGWVLISVEGTSLSADGQNILFNRVQNKSLSDEVNFKAYDGNNFIDLTLYRVKGGYPVQSFIVVD